MSPIHERISFTEPPETRIGHEARYRLAAGFLRPGDTVIDAAAGCGYGRDILTARGSIGYFGVEKDLSVIEVAMHDDFIEADLNLWEPPFPYEAVVAFETIEHLDDPTAYVEWSSRARVVFVSVPLRPTVHENPHHKRDYTAEDIERMYVSLGLYAYFYQPAESSGVWVFGRP